MARIPPCSEGDLGENSVKPNELLLWISARREGSWRAFRAAVEELHLAEAPEGDGGEEFRGSDFPQYERLRLNMEPVSYTHLDVYKRQAMHKRLLRRVGFGSTNTSAAGMHFT